MLASPRLQYKYMEYGFNLQKLTWPPINREYIYCIMEDTQGTFDCRVILSVVQQVAVRDDATTGFFKNNDWT